MKMSVIPQGRARNTERAVAPTESSRRRRQEGTRAAANKANQSERQSMVPKPAAQTLKQEYVDAAADTISNLRLRLDEVTTANVQLRGESEAAQLRLQRQMTDQTDQIRKLHAIIMSQGEKRDALDDEAIRMEFCRLGTSVQRLVKKHFPVAGMTGYAEFNQIEDQEDRVYFLRATICNMLAENFFSPGRKHFGISDALDETLGDFKKELERSDRK